jgi:hypothetical protein
LKTPWNVYCMFEYAKNIKDKNLYIGRLRGNLGK